MSSAVAMETSPSAPGYQAWNLLHGRGALKTAPHACAIENKVSSLVEEGQAPCPPWSGQPGQSRVPGPTGTGVCVALLQRSRQVLVSLLPGVLQHI